MLGLLSRGVTLFNAQGKSPMHQSWKLQLLWSVQRAQTELLRSCSRMSVLLTQHRIWERVSGLVSSGGMTSQLAQCAAAATSQIAIVKSARLSQRWPFKAPGQRKESFPSQVKLRNTCYSRTALPRDKGLSGELQNLGWGYYSSKCSYELALMISDAA